MELNYHCWQARRAQMDIQICHRGHITQMCHILMWKVRWSIQTVAGKEFRNGHCLWLCCQLCPSCWYGTCTFEFVFSYHWHTGGFGRWFMGPDSQFILGALCRKSYYLWWGKKYVWRNPNPWSDSFLAEVFLAVTSLGSWNEGFVLAIYAPSYHFSPCGLFRLWIN